MKNSDSDLECYTIGYSDLPREVFLYFIKKKRIETIVDVRSTPYSSYQPDYNQIEFKHFLESNEIKYQYYGDRIGGRYTEPDLLFEDGIVNYEKVRKQPEFQTAIDDLIEQIKQTNRICLMCSEKKPEQCHRFVLISRELQERGIHVFHIIPSIDVISNKKLEGDLFHEMFDTAQRNLISHSKPNLDEFYQKLNQTIGYRAESPAQKNQDNNSNLETFEFTNQSCENEEDRFLTSDNKINSGGKERTKTDSKDDIQYTLF